MIITKEEEIEMCMHKYDLTRTQAKKWLGIETATISYDEIKRMCDKFCREEKIINDRRKNKATQNKTKNIGARISRND